MKLKLLPDALTVCKLASLSEADLTSHFYFLAKTDEELSLVCATGDVPTRTTAREDGWRGLRVEGVLDFSLVGILARLSSALAAEGISLFAVSTFNTDYLLVKADQLDGAIRALARTGYETEA
ncbi:MAG: ACT domain-containing protein [Clostridia bacterium]|nr:ACT domain-containing protein [Clostridia bacterium]